MDFYCKLQAPRTFQCNSGLPTTELQESYHRAAAWKFILSFIASLDGSDRDEEVNCLLKLKNYLDG
jgi:hypothetical protein